MIIHSAFATTRSVTKYPAPQKSRKRGKEFEIRKGSFNKTYFKALFKTHTIFCSIKVIWIPGDT